MQVMGLLKNNLLHKKGIFLLHRLVYYIPAILGPQFGTNYIPRFRTLILDLNFGPRFGTLIWDPDLGPRFRTPI
jgi:hypothetical protein